MLLPFDTRRLGSAALAVACLAISGCGTVTTGTSTTGTTPDGQRTTAPAATGDPGEQAAAPTLPYVPWGPADPVVPQWYADVAGTRCTGESPRGEPSAFWDTAWAVCRAVFDDGPWPGTTSSPPPPPARDPHDACLDDELRQFVDRALAWRSAHPDATPRVDRAAEPSPCFLRVYDVRLDDDGPEDGELVRAVLTVDGTYRVSSVRVDGVETDPPPSSGGQSLQEVELALPRTDTDRTVQVTLQFSSAAAVMGSTTAPVVVPGLSASSPEPSAAPASPSAT